MVKIKINRIRLFLFTVIFAVVILLCIGIYIIKRGGIYSSQRLEICKSKGKSKNQKDEFCGIQEINLTIPEKLKQEILAKAGDPDSGKRVVLPKWKSGRTITTSEVIQSMPEVWEWYKSLTTPISSIIGKKVTVTQNFLPTSCAVLIYENDGDFINWHYDVNYFNGESFTLLVPITFTDLCTKYVYIDAHQEEKSLKNTEGKSILFEGEKVFHAATKFCRDSGNEKRIVLSMQFTSDSTISWYNRALMRLKDIAYIGI